MRFGGGLNTTVYLCHKNLEVHGNLRKIQNTYKYFQVKKTSKLLVLLASTSSNGKSPKFLILYYI